LLLVTPVEFAEFYELWHQPMVRYMIWKTRQIDDADDLVQDVFTDMANRVPSLVLATASRYLWVAVRRRAIMARVNAAKKRRAILDDGYYNRLHYPSASFPDLEVIDRILFSSALDTLKPVHRQVLERLITDDEKVKVIADEMQISSQRVGQIRDAAMIRMWFNYYKENHAA
jgi:DNA-directed RNA polymerase specialized sigma24 family protein